MDGRLFGLGADPDVDEHAWLLGQAEALRSRRLTAIDCDALAEFLDSMAKRDVREALSQVERLLMHLIKFTVQPQRATSSWAISVVNAQNELQDMLDSAALRRAVEEKLPRAWERARRSAAAETRMAIAAMPAENPWSLDEALSWTPPFGLPQRVK
ncbi:DUF29 domain-containing protein [Roseomonas stagni]|uniref:DUF29 domain-containing protein n=1 Tax=Falsiroseomonas algicola TaxID=2716930 RepID=A0A6M1LSY2_9PROT|nr:DUF29 domain-containing protein [Falsiroseomonas algicola]NGM23596.1 DUF29 domain-containing protein [Falsiroseomonas algicola]